MIRMDDWLNRNKLYLNVSKTKVMLIRGVRRKVAENNFKVKFRGEYLEVVNKIKYLGVMIDRSASVLIGIGKTNLQYMQKLQNKAMRIILKCNRSVRIIDMLEALKFKSINERIEYNVCLLVFKMINGQCPSYL